MVHLVAFYDMQDHSSIHSHVCPRYRANRDIFVRNIIVLVFLKKMMCHTLITILA